tara:strand:- start:613 stop:720 length:108 start_codon:yes stop_codon:yes gene_type:complete
MLGPGARWNDDMLNRLRIMLFGPPVSGDLPDRVRA